MSNRILLEFGAGINMERLLTPIDRVAAIKADSKYTMALVAGKGWVFVVPPKSKYIALATLLEQFPDDLLRINRNILINKSYLDGFTFERNTIFQRVYFAFISIDDFGKPKRQRLPVSRRTAMSLCDAVKGLAA